jgi:outer membrane biosynthesis protein TonB
MLGSASAFAAQSTINATAAVSTGVIAPEILDRSVLRVPAEALALTAPGESQLVLSLYVDAKGNAESVHVVKSVNPTVDAYVVNEVLQARFRPAMLNNHAVTAPMNLVVTVQR